MGALDRYSDNLTNPVAPGSGCHSWIMSTANLGVIAGKDPHEIQDDIRRSIPAGTRRIPDREIHDAINKALADYNGGNYVPRPRPAPLVKDGNAALQKIISQTKIHDEADLWEASPLRLSGEPGDDAALLFETLFKPDDLIFVGERHDTGIIAETIRTAGEWKTHFKDGGKTAPFIIVNPLNGIPAHTKSSDKTTLRGDGNITSFRHCIGESDTLSREDQICFWSAVKLPVVALIDSGGKSIHAWLNLAKLGEVETLEQWQAKIKGRLYDRLLVPLGIDGACSNPARLSRLPGHYREEKKAWQRLLWLSPEGRSVDGSV
ncbi:MAG: hypothetical protein ABSC57_10835 [Syntrophales bacterium]